MVNKTINKKIIQSDKFMERRKVPTKPANERLATIETEVTHVAYTLQMHTAQDEKSFTAVTAQFDKLDTKLSTLEGKFDTFKWFVMKHIYGAAGAIIVIAFLGKLYIH